MEKLLLTPEEAADALGVGRSKVYQLLGAGHLFSVKIGACRRVPQAAVRSYVDSLYEEAS